MPATPPPTEPTPEQLAAARELLAGYQANGLAALKTCVQSPAWAEVRNAVSAAREALVDDVGMKIQLDAIVGCFDRLPRAVAGLEGRIAVAAASGQTQ